MLWYWLVCVIFIKQLIDKNNPEELMDRNITEELVTKEYSRKKILKLIPEWIFNNYILRAIDF